MLEEENKLTEEKENNNINTNTNNLLNENLLNLTVEKSNNNNYLLKSNNSLLLEDNLNAISNTITSLYRSEWLKLNEDYHNVIAALNNINSEENNINNN